MYCHMSGAGGLPINAKPHPGNISFMHASLGLADRIYLDVCIKACVNSNVDLLDFRLKYI